MLLNRLTNKPPPERELSVSLPTVVLNLTNSWTCPLNSSWNSFTAVLVEDFNVVLSVSLWVSSRSSAPLLCPHNKLITSAKALHRCNGPYRLAASSLSVSTDLVSPLNAHVQTAGTHIVYAHSGNTWLCTRGQSFVFLISDARQQCGAGCAPARLMLMPEHSLV
jgi:hypothetical protein